MSAPVTSQSLFFGAIADLIRAPGAVLRIAALPLLAYLLIEVPLSRAYVQWFNDTTLITGPPGEVIGTLAFFLLLAVLAVSWHRHMLVAETPDTFLPKMRWRNWGRYLVAWIIISVIAGLAVFLCVLLPLFLLGSVLDPLLGQLLLNLLSYDVYLDPSPTPAFYVAGIAVGILALFAYLTLVFRISMGLPAVAIDAATAPGLRASWRRTRALTWPILGLAAFALVGQALLTGAGFLVLFSGGFSETITFAGEYTIRAMLAVIDTVNTLAGAAILTRIYRAVEPVPEA